MKLYQLKCPACGGNIEIEQDKEYCFCIYCGTKIYINDGTQKIEINKNINYHKTYTDEAKILKIEAEERMTERKYANEQEERKQKKWSDIRTAIIVFSCFIVALILISIMVSSAKAVSDRQEQKLQSLVDEIMIDIENENFSEAYVKVEQLYYTADYSDDITKKWDKTRKSILEQIKKAEKEAKNESSDTWWNPFD